MPASSVVRLAVVAPPPTSVQVSLPLGTVRFQYQSPVWPVIVSVAVVSVTALAARPEVVTAAVTEGAVTSP